MHREIARCLGLIALFSIGSSLAHAQSEPGGEPEVADSSTERARALFNEGLDLADQGDWERAVHRFRSALELREAVPVRYNLATSLARMGRLVEALEEVERILATPEVPVDVSESALTLRSELEPRLGRLTVEVRGEASDAHVTVDGRPWHSLGVALRADPGIRVVRLLQEMTVLDLTEADVPEGGVAEVTLEVPAARVDRLADRTAAPASDDTWIWAVVIPVIVLLAAGAVLTAVLVSEQGPSASTGDFMPPLLVVD